MMTDQSGSRPIHPVEGVRLARPGCERQGYRFMPRLRGMSRGKIGGGVIAALAVLARRFAGDRRGAVAPMLALMLVPLIGSMALAGELSSWLMINRSMQNAAKLGGPRGGHQRQRGPGERLVDDLRLSGRSLQRHRQLRLHQRLQQRHGDGDQHRRLPQRQRQHLLPGDDHQGRAALSGPDRPGYYRQCDPGRPPRRIDHRHRHRFGQRQQRAVLRHRFGERRHHHPRVAERRPFRLRHRLQQRHDLHRP